ncbi:MAG: endonuclease/exonuclease/phosphatase family protein [Alphaproteobacteria bacterium]
MHFLTYNMQAAIGAEHYLGYVTKLHKQVIHTKEKSLGLLKIARMIRKYDIVCLQEVDLGGLRSGYKSQADILQEYTKHPFMLSQINRRVGRFSIHGNMILSRYPLTLIDDSNLPSKLSGRGALVAQANIDGTIYNIINTHLSLGPRDQKEQFTWLADKIRPHHNIILCGDFNCQPQAEHLQAFALRANLQLLTNNELKTFPSWKPQKSLDHILISKDLMATDCQVLPHKLSDHLAVSVCIKTDEKQ